MNIKEERQNEDDICIWDFSNWVMVSRTGMENSVWNRFSGKNKEFCFGCVCFKIPIKYPVKYLDILAWSSTRGPG